MQIRIRADSVDIEGYVNAVGRNSRRIYDEWGGSYVEQIAPGAFARALSAQAEPIPILLDHNDTRQIGSTDQGAELKEDTIGLYCRATFTDPEVIQAARDQKLSGWSFGFIDLDSVDDWTGEGRQHTVKELKLMEVSLIDDKMIPVYAGTSVNVRAEDKGGKVILRAMDSDTVSYITAETAEADLHIEEQEPEAPTFTAEKNAISALRAHI